MQQRTLMLTVSPKSCHPTLLVLFQEPVLQNCMGPAIPLRPRPVQGSPGGQEGKTGFRA